MARGPRISGPSTSKRPKGRPKPQKRSLNALSIAAKQNPEKTKIRQSRLGELEDQRPQKRRNQAADDESGSENATPGPRTKRRRRTTDGLTELEAEEGSDSEGNQWRLGHVSSDEDSDLDSDEAFGESDEERYGGFAFRGSSSAGKGQFKVRSKPTRGSNAPGEIRLDSEEEGVTDEEGSLGSENEGMDMATLLDETADDGTGASRKKRRVSPDQQSDPEGDDESDSLSDGNESQSDLSFSDAEPGDEDPDRLSTLQQLVASLESPSAHARLRDTQPGEFYEAMPPSDYGLSTSQKLTVDDLLSTVTDSKMRSSLRLLSSELDGSKRTGHGATRLSAPLPKRQQDRLDRAAAYDKSKETLDRWVDTVKHNRRAEHLSFPLIDPSALPSKGSRRFTATASSVPFNELESTIQSILIESGLSTVNEQENESKIGNSEELQLQKIPLELAQARRAQLRMARELLFREEKRSKRIKKIKSKSYRRIHRKQRERSERNSLAAMAMNGEDLSEGEQEMAEKRRAEERMGAKHRESAWAKRVKASHRSTWDMDARDGVMEMARREEELKRRIIGKPAKDHEADMSSNDDESNNKSGDSESSGPGQNARLLNQLRDNETLEVAEGPHTKLSLMPFMVKANSARRAQNDAELRQLEKELAGDKNPEEDVDGLSGRRKYGPNQNGAKADKSYPPQDEQGSSGDEEQGERPSVPGNDAGDTNHWKTIHNKPRGLEYATEQGISQIERGSAQGSTLLGKSIFSGSTDGAYSLGRSRQGTEKMDKHILKKSKAASGAAPIHNAEHKTNPNKTSAVTDSHNSQPSPVPSWSNDVESGEDNDAEPTDGLPSKPLAMLSQQELRLKAFAGDEVVRDFEVEKRQTIAEEEDQIIDNTLPGWGNWTGAGVSKKMQKRNSGRFLTKVEGIKEKNRKDAKLERVIVNEKRVKKNAKYLASSLPHPFETRQQYERSLRLPVGPEWTTKETFQNVTKPRVLIKQGVIAPMEKPLL